MSLEHVNLTVSDLDHSPSTTTTPGPASHFGLVVDNLDEARRRLDQLGATVHREADYEPGRRIYFLDPDGHEVELVEY
jgi:catechol 2,3-dioxygenase-like lactoylglutathione lyase family enzyme